MITSTINQQLKKRNIERLTNTYIRNFVIPDHIEYKKNDATQTVKGFINGKFVLFIDVLNDILIFTPFITELFATYGIIQNVIIISETMNKKELLDDLEKQGSQTLQYIVYKNGQYIL